MGDDDNTNTNTNTLLLPPRNPSLPAGCRFFPSEQQLLSIYLTRKHHQPSNNYDVIKEMNLYDYAPFNLPDSICFPFGRGGRKRHYYCYVPRVRGRRRRRAGASGFWNKTGRLSNVLHNVNNVIGTRSCFVFYIGDSHASVRTDWFMYEYALLHPNLASFVLCRVFVKTRKTNTNTSPDRPLSSCAHDSVAKVRHIGIQHGGTVDLVPTDSNMLRGNSPEVLRFPMEVFSGSDNVVIGWPVDLQLGSFRHTTARGMMGDPLTADQLTAISEEDFLELDDLLSPYPGID